VESVFDGGCVVGVHLPPRAVVLDFEIESRRVHLECAVPGIQSPPHLLILCSHRFEPPLAPFPVPHFLLEMGESVEADGYRKYRIHCDLLFHSENIWEY
jgi:hypothetical protein